MNIKLNKYLELSDRKHDSTLKNISTTDNINDEMSELRKEISVDVFIEALNLENLKDWQKKDIGGALLHYGKKEIAKEVFKKLQNSDDKLTKIDIYTLLNVIIPQLEKEGKV